MSHVYLIGFLESGNVTLGKQLAERLKLPFVDTNAVLRERADASPKALYAEAGPDGLRRHQQDVLQSVAEREPAVIAVADNVPLQPSDWDLLQRTGTTVYIQRSAERLYWRLRHDPHQPALLDTANQTRHQKIASLLAEREPGYLQADIVLPTHHEQVPEIVALLAEQLST